MADGYKIKTDDGSLLGPMTLQSVEGFFRQGLVKHDNMVQRPGSYNWVPLAEVLAKDLKKAAAPKKAAPPPPAPQPARPRPPALRPESDDRPASSGGSGGALKLLVAVALVAVVAGGAFFGYQMMQRPAPAATPEPSPDVQPQALREQREKAIEVALVETPQFSRATIELLMAGSAAEVLEPPEVFRRGQLAVSRGLGQLTPSESRELGALMQAAYAPLPAKDRARLGAYLDRLKTTMVTKPEEDRELTAVMKAGVSKLSRERRARLQALFDKAVRAGSRAR